MTRLNQGLDTGSPPLPVWSGYFESWVECQTIAAEKSAYPNNVRAFESERWVNRQLAMYTDASQGLYPRACALPSVSAAVLPMSIVDFGGGSGWPFQLLDPRIRRTLSTYLVIEQEKLVAQMHPLSSEEEILHFSSLKSLQSGLVEPIDVLYSNSVIQYLDSWSDIEVLLNTLNPNWILLEDVQVSSGREFLSLQHYYGTYIPCRFFCLEDLVALMDELGYSCRGRWPYPKTYASGALPVIADAEGAPYTVSAPVSCLFSKVY